MPRLSRFSLLLLAATALGPGCARTGSLDNAGDAAEALPSADALIARAVEASGGEAALRAHRSYRMTGTFQMQAQGIAGQMSIWANADGEMYSRVTLEGIGVMEEGVRGDLAWSRDPLTGPRVKSGIEAVQAKRAADFYQLLSLDERYPTRETLRLGQLEGQPVYEVRLVPAEGPEEIAYFDVSSGLEVGSKMTLQTAMGDVTVTSINGDFRSTGGVLLPFQTRMVNSLMTSSVTWTEIVWDPADLGMPPVPDEVLALAASAAGP